MDKSPTLDTLQKTTQIQEDRKTNSNEVNVNEQPRTIPNKRPNARTTQNEAGRFAN